MKYTWNKDVSRDLKSSQELAVIQKPERRFNVQELGLFVPKTSKIDLLYRNSAYLTLNPFCENDITKAIKTNPKVPRSKFHFTRITIDEAMEYARSFYSSMTSPIVEAFEWAYDRKEGRIKSKLYNPLADLSAQSFLYPEAKDYLMVFANENNIYSFMNIVHEFAHIIAFYLRDFKRPDFSNQVFTEIESNYFELLLLDYFKDNDIMLSDLINRRRIYLSSLLKQFNIVQCWYPLAKYLSMYPNIPLIDVYYNAYESLGMGVATVNKLIKNPAEAYLPMIFAELVATELFFIYEQNPKEAMDLYFKMLNLKGPSAIEKDAYLRTLVTPGEHFTDSVDMLKR